MKKPGDKTQADADLLRSRAEAKLWELKDAKPEEIRRLIHDLQIHQIRLTIQNEALQHTQEELNASQARFQNLYDFAPIGYLTVSEEGFILEANLTAATMMGVDRGELIRKPLARFILPADQEIYYNFRKQLLMTDENQMCELRLSQPDRPPLLARLSATSTQHIDGAPVFRVIIDNITERKQAELYRALSAEILEILNESADFKGAIQRILEVLLKKTGCDAAGIRLRNGDDFPFFVQKGFSNRFLSMENFLIRQNADGDICRNYDRTIMLECICGAVISGKTDPSSPLFTPGGSFWTNDSSSLSQLSLGDDLQCHMRNRCINDGCLSMALVPIRARANIIGLLQVNGNRKGQFSLQAIQALENIAIHIGEAVMRKEVQDALRLANDYNRSLIEVSLDPLVTIGPDGTITDVNQATEMATGYRREELIGMDFVDYFTDPALARGVYQQVFKEGRVHDYSLNIRHRDGHTTPVLYNASVYQDTTGQIIGVFAAARDITKLKQAEEAQFVLERKLLQAKKAESLGRMAGAIAHNFNNLLAGVMGYIELAMADLTKESHTFHSLTEAMNAATRAADVSHLMLTYLGQTYCKHERMELSEVCRQSMPTLRASMPKEVTLNVDLPSAGPTIKGDLPQIQQLLTHLITNAWESIGKGQGIIHLSLKTISPADIPETRRLPIEWQPMDIPYACLEVADSGCGIPAENIDKLFDPFFTSKFMGRGLGLPVVLGIVKAHGGAVTLESDLGQGSLFRVFLPVLVENVTPTL